MVGGKLPLAPMLATAVCVAGANVVLAFLLSRALFPASAPAFGPTAIVALMVAAVASGAYAVFGWRAYLRGRRGRG